MGKRGLVVIVLLGVLAGLVWGGWSLSRSRNVQLFGQAIDRVETDRKIIALSFDDGPTARTSEIIALLAAKNVRASFFLTGREIQDRPEQARALVAAGHEIGNHSFGHPRMVFMSMDRIRSEIDSTDALIRTAGFQGPILFRPPYGKKLVMLPLFLSRQGRVSVMWSLEPESVPRPTEDADEITRRVVDAAQPGDIILMHLMYQSRAASRQALPQVIDGLRDRGFEFVTVGEMVNKVAGR